MSDKNKKNIFTKPNYLNVSVLFFKNFTFSKVSPVKTKQVVRVLGFLLSNLCQDFPEIEVNGYS
jgi:hypothetical protein